MPLKILLAMDDSDNALRAAALVASCFRTDSHVTLFNVGVDTATLCNLDSPSLTPYFKSQQGRFCALEEKKGALVEVAISNARQILIDKGFDAERVAAKVRPKKMGVARDILTEARQGYDLLVVGRQGFSGVKEFFAGSTANKVFSYAKDIGILVVP
jgi:nucleotide-binding universal stress UspA family protein